MSTLNDYAKLNGLTRDEFFQEVIATTASIGELLIKENRDLKDGVTWKITDKKTGKITKVIVVAEL